MMRLLLGVLGAASMVQGEVRSRRLNYFRDTVVDGLETEYNEYATSWRLLGLYVDCQEIAQEERRRHLEDGGDDEAEEDQDEDAEEEDADAEGDDQAAQDDDAQQQQQQNQQECGRYLLWAAYVDVDYEGGGLSEYKIFDASAHKYDTSACSGGRCVKMDCHSSGTSYKPLGYFRQDNPTEFMQLLANYQGSCSWKDDEYSAVLTAGWLPKGCTQLGDNDLFYDYKPLYGGAIDIGVYADEHCSQESTAYVDIGALISEQAGEDVDVSQQLSLINSAMNTFKVCQPCRTYDLSVPYYNPNAQANDDQEEGDDDAAEEEENDDNNNEDPNHFNFVCNDMAGNNGINMCEAFAQNSEISAATMSEVYSASSTGTIERPFGGADATASFLESWGFFLLSALVFMAGITCFCCVAVKRKKVGGFGNREPLVRRS